jgi:hypothetical protein
VGAPDSLWELVFLMVILKIPIVYLCTIVYYAIKAEPRRGHGTRSGVPADPDDQGPGWGRRPRPRRLPPRRPHGGPSRGYARTARAATARARLDRR